MNAAIDVLSPGRFRRVAPLNASCIACGEKNVRGLHLHFTIAGETASASWTPSEGWQGFQGVIHGGIVATVLDESMSKAVVAGGWEAFTVELTVRLKARVAPGEELTVRGMVVRKQRREILAEASLIDSSGKERAHAWGKFLVPR